MDHLARVLAHEVRLDLLHGLCHRERPALDNRLAQAGDPGIRMDFQEQPARLHQHGLQPGDLDPILGKNRS